MKITAVSSVMIENKIFNRIKRQGIKKEPTKNKKKLKRAKTQKLTWFDVQLRQNVKCSLS